MAIDEAIRRDIQASRDSLRAAARRLGVDIKTVRKWRARLTPVERRRGRRPGEGSKLTPIDESIIICFRHHSELSLDDCLYALQTTIPHLTRSSLHRCLQRYGVARQRRVPGESEWPGTLFVYLRHIPITGGSSALYMAVDRASKIIQGRIFDRFDPADAGRFVDHLVLSGPMPVHEIMVEQLPSPPITQESGVQATPACSMPVEPLVEACRRHGIRLTMVEGLVPAGSSFTMAAGAAPPPSRALYGKTADARQRMERFLTDYNDGRRMKGLRGRTPREHLAMLQGGRQELSDR